MANIYQFEETLSTGKKVSLSIYREKVLLIVNIASKCGFTSQLGQLETLYKDYKDKAFEILAFPCNQFLNQEPLNSTEVSSFCEVNYGVTFPIFSKTKVIGSKADPLFTFLSKKRLNGNISSTPMWNFHKYLVNKKGEVVSSFFTFTNPNGKKVRKQIDNLLAE